MTKIISPLVGAHFRPPAKVVLARLPVGTPLHLHPEPENQYDSDAIAVRVRTADIPEEQWENLRLDLPACGWDLQGLLDLPQVQLGYCASSKNPKTLGTIAGSVGNIRVGEALLSPTHSARLVWVGEQPGVEVEF